MATKMKGMGNILIVEDSVSQAQTLTNILNKEGYHVFHAKDGLEGLYLLMELTPDAIISDIWMPRMNGYEFCQIVKKDPKLNNIPFILLTSLSSIEDIIRGLNAGADYYFTKPYNEETLLDILNNIFKEPHLYVTDDHKVPYSIKYRDIVKNVRVSCRQTLNFLVSTYESFVYQNKKLLETKKKLKTLNENLEERVKEKIKSIEATLEGVVKALAMVVELRDPYTAGHQLRVSNFATEIAKRMGLSNEIVDGIKTIGLLHDIGKIIVPAEVLSKPSRLTDYEFRFIKEHPQAGYDILKGIEFPIQVALAVLQHHERIDGSGYPQGLTDENILLEAKIIAVADVLESMASHRPYRPALGINAAIEEVTKNKSRLYDSEVVEVAISILNNEENKIIR